jgi:hypothetical protein
MEPGDTQQLGHWRPCLSVDQIEDRGVFSASPVSLAEAMAQVLSFEPTGRPLIPEAMAFLEISRELANRMMRDWREAVRSA